MKLRHFYINRPSIKCWFFQDLSLFITIKLLFLALNLHPPKKKRKKRIVVFTWKWWLRIPLMFPKPSTELNVHFSLNIYRLRHLLAGTFHKSAGRIEPLHLVLGDPFTRWNLFCVFLKRMYVPARCTLSTTQTLVFRPYCG